MPGRINNHINELQGWSNVFGKWPDTPLRYNLAPNAPITAFRHNHGETMRWGLIPSWSPEFESNYPTFDAHIETIENKASFKSAWKKSQRCLIPIAGYYEWQGEKGNKQPYYVTDRFSGGLVVAGIYESWKLDKFLSCAMLSKPADKGLSQLHPRVPILLTPENAHDWLSATDNLDIDEIININRPKVSYYKVGKVVGNTDIENSHLIEPQRV